jgi:hypothetical protein
MALEYLDLVPAPSQFAGGDTHLPLSSAGSHRIRHDRNSH